jgi:hypothetical protein
MTIILQDKKHIGDDPEKVKRRSFIHYHLLDMSFLQDEHINPVGIIRFPNSNFVYYDILEENMVHDHFWSIALEIYDNYP